MSRATQFRRAVAVLKAGRGQPVPPPIGNRSLHHYWALLKTHFRGILLPPQSLADGAGTQWTWSEPIGRPPLGATELATVRKRLAGSQRSLADSVADATESGAAEAHRTVSVLPQLQACMDATVAALIALPDASLAAYVARTEQGPLLHSWGLTSALAPQYPDATDCEISGTVLVANSPAGDREVLLESVDGRPLGRTQSDAAGKFSFPKVAPGNYRARVVSTRDAFPPEGVLVEIDRASVTGLELRDCGDDRLATAPRPKRRRRRMVPFILFSAAAIIAVGFAWWGSTDSAPATMAEAKPPTPTNAASERFVQGRVKENPPAPASASFKVDAAPTPARVTKTKSSDPDANPRPRVMIEHHTDGVSIESATPAALSGRPASASSVPGRSAGAGGVASSGVGTTAPGNSTPHSRAAAAGATSASASVSHPTAASSIAAIAAVMTPPAPPARPAPRPQPSPAQTTPPPPDPNPTAPQSTAGAAPAPTKSQVPASEAPASGSAESTPTSAPSAPLETSDPSRNQQPAKDSPPIDQSAPESFAVSPGGSPSTSPPGNPASDDDRKPSTALVRSADVLLRAQIRTARWQPRLVQDSILPTAPTRVGDDDTVGVLRERLLRERHDQLPELFTQPVVWIGFVLELPADAAGASHAHWHNTSDAAAARAAVMGTRAEIAWRSNPPPGIAATLLSDGRTLAQISVDALGRLSLLTVADLRGWPWVAVERPTTDNDRLTALAWADRLEWRVLSGAPAAPTWRRDDRWQNGQGHRLDLLPAARTTGPTVHSLALIDRLTGWALVSEVEQTSEFYDESRKIFLATP